jgi:macrolide transport system ATP-binding/permease protein
VEPRNYQSSEALTVFCVSESPAPKLEYDGHSRPRMHPLFMDLRFALRQLRRAPGFFAAAILVLTLGIAASVTVFVFFNAALMKPLPYRDP